MLVRYENFAAQPATVLKEVGEFLGFDAGELSRREYMTGCESVYREGLETQ